MSEATSTLTRPNRKLNIWISGRCPMGCGETLFLAQGGHITCSYDECPNPDAVSDWLKNPAKTVRVYADEYST